MRHSKYWDKTRIGRDMIQDELHRQSLSRWQWRKRKWQRFLNSILFWRS
jgi:hypothetical protein